MKKSLFRPPSVFSFTIPTALDASENPSFLVCYSGKSNTFSSLGQFDYPNHVGENTIHVPLGLYPATFYHANLVADPSS